MIAEDLASLAVPLASLQLLPGNPRRGDVGAVARSLERFGQRKPIVARRSDRVVVAGNHTLEAARKLGWSEIAAVWVDDDETTARAFALADNRTAELGGYDDEALAAMVSAVHNADPELLEATGWTEVDLAELVARAAKPLEGLTDPDAVPEPPAEPVTQPGDLWLLGEHRLLCGDCRDIKAVDRLLEGRQVNLVVTSPPYASQRKYDEGSGFKPIPPDEYGDWFAEVASVIWAALAEDGSFLLNLKEHCEDGERHLYAKKLVIQLRESGWKFVDEFCWADTRDGFPGAFPNRFKNAWEPVFHFAKAANIKFRPQAVGHDSPNAFAYSSSTHIGMTDQGYEKRNPRQFKAGKALPSNVVYVAAGGEGTHQAAYPVELPAWFVRAFSDPGDQILDPFVGSGTTIIAAQQEGRKGYGVEISPTYCDVICRRFQEFTGILPKLESTGEEHDFGTPSGKITQTA